MTLYDSALLDPTYAATHSRFFDGPLYLNISALQMEPRIVAENEAFRPYSMYDVYKNGVKVVSCERLEPCLKKLSISSKTFQRGLKKQHKEILVIKVKEAVTKYTFKKDNEAFSLTGSKAVRERFKCKRGTEPATYAKQGAKFRGYTVTMDYVIIDIEERI